MSLKIQDSFSSLSKEIFFIKVKPGPSKLEKIVDPGRGPVPTIGVHYLDFDFFWSKFR
jgi:hypothetical protein